MSQKVFGIDFGTQTIQIYKKGQGIIFNEKSIVAIATGEKKAIAVGDKAFAMYEKAPGSIRVNFPLHHGVIADMQDMIELWNYAFDLFSKEFKCKTAEFYIAVPCDLNEVEKRGFYDVLSASRLKIKKAVLIDKPIVSALGAGLDIHQTKGSLLVDMGADSTEISVLAQGGIVTSKLLPLGSNIIDAAVRSHLHTKEHFSTGEKTCELIKQYYCAHYPTETVYEVKGRNIVNGLPGKITINGEIVYPVIDSYLNQIAENITAIIERTPPEISGEIMQDGIVLCGGGCQIHNIEQILREKTGLRITICPDPQTAVINGIGKLIEQPGYSSYYLSRHGSITITK